MLSWTLILENDCQQMYEEGGIDLLLIVCKKCIGNEETVRMACQVLRVITAADGFLKGVSLLIDDGTKLLLQNNRIFQLLNSVLLQYAQTSSAILLHCLLIVLYILKQTAHSSDYRRSDLIDEILDMNIIATVHITLERHREPHLLRVAFILLYELSSFRDTNTADTINRIIQEIHQYEILPLTVLVIQFLSIESDTLISALNFLILSCHRNESRKLLYECGCVTILAKFIQIQGVPFDVQVLCIALLSRLASLGFNCFFD